MSGVRTDSGKRLAQQWGVDVKHALYHKEGIWYMPLERFPGAYFDPNGYLRFEASSDYERNPNLRIGSRVNVPGGISRVPGYKFCVDIFRK